MSSSAALLWAAGVLPEFDPDRAGAASPIPGAGSDRRLTRLHFSGPSLILAENPSPAGEGPNENDSFVYLSKHLGGHGLPVPKIIAYERERGFYLMEDLGDGDLYGEVARQTAGEGVEPLYRKAVDVLIRLQTEGAQDSTPAGATHRPGTTAVS